MTRQHAHIGVLLVALTLVLTLAMAAGVRAKADNGAMAFSIAPALPDNQISDAHYFDLRMAPSQVQDLTVYVTNESASPMDLQVEAVTPYSNPNGLIQYTQLPDTNETLPLAFSELVTISIDAASPPQEGTAGQGMTTGQVQMAARGILENTSVVTEPTQLVSGVDESLYEPLPEYLNAKRVRIDAGGRVAVRFRVTMPDTPFDGELLGGLRFLQLRPPTDAAEGMSVRSTYAYMVAALITMTDTQIPTEISLQGASAQMDGLNRLTFTMRNEQPAIVKNYALALEVYTAEDQAEPVITWTQERVSFAPLSTMAYRVLLEEALAEGEYTARLTLTKENEAPIIFDTAFTVEDAA